MQQTHNKYLKKLLVILIFNSYAPLEHVLPDKIESVYKEEFKNSKNLDEQSCSLQLSLLEQNDKKNLMTLSISPSIKYQPFATSYPLLNRDCDNFDLQFSYVFSIKENQLIALRKKSQTQKTMVAKQISQKCDMLEIFQAGNTKSSSTSELSFEFARMECVRKCGDYANGASQLHERDWYALKNIMQSINDDVTDNLFLIASWFQELKKPSTVKTISMKQNAKLTLPRTFIMFAISTAQVLIGSYSLFHKNKNSYENETIHQQTLLNHFEYLPYATFPIFWHSIHIIQHLFNSERKSTIYTNQDFGSIAIAPSSKSDLLSVRTKLFKTKSQIFDILLCFDLSQKRLISVVAQNAYTCCELLSISDDEQKLFYSL